MDQKTGYIVGKPITITSEDKKLEARIKEVLGMKWNDTLQDLVTGASNKSREEIQPFIDSNGDFDYAIIPAEQVIYITDTTHQKKVIQAIRYYAMQWVDGDEVKESLRIELWDKEKVTRYQEIEDGFGESYYQMIVDRKSVV